MGKRVTALITAMDQPLGRAVGNSLEIMESIDVLKGRGPADSTELTLALAAEMLVVAGVAPTPEAGLAVVRRKWQSGEPFEVFKKMVRLHGGDTEFLDDPRRFPRARMQKDVPASEIGFVQDVDAEKIGRASLLLGAGRAKTTDSIDYSAGLSNLMKIGEPVVAGVPLVTLHAATQDRLDAAMGLVREAFVLGPASVSSGPLVLEKV
jgi:thymidine phosphorylase